VSDPVYRVVWGLDRSRDFVTRQQAEVEIDYLREHWWDGDVATEPRLSQWFPVDPGTVSGPEVGDDG
jgi:hypothetical protein